MSCAVGFGGPRSQQEQQYAPGDGAASGDHSAAQDLALRGVEHAGLAGCDGANRGAERKVSSAAPVADDGGRHGAGPIADLHLAAIARMRAARRAN